MDITQETASMPSFDNLIVPVFKALKALGGSGRNDEILQRVISDMKLPDEICDMQHGTSGMSEIAYRMTWTRNYMKIYGIIENSSRGVWSLTTDYVGRDECPDSSVIVQEVKKKQAAKKQQGDTAALVVPGAQIPAPDTSDALPQAEPTWQSRLLRILHTMDPYGFERFAQRLLRELGFEEVGVTKKSGDDGIDGIGLFKINDVLSFNVAFQCKRYQGTVGSPEVRDFRGSLTADVEKGILITTGTFTAAAEKEAHTPSKTRIDLIDGQELISLITKLGLGVKPVEAYEIDEDFFKAFNSGTPDN